MNGEPPRCSGRKLLLVLLTAVLTMSACYTGPRGAPDDNRPMPDTCAMLDRALAQLGKFHPVPELRDQGRSTNCVRNETCRASDDDCADRKHDLKRQVWLIIAGVNFDYPGLAEGREVRKTSVNGRKSVFWVQPGRFGSWDCKVMMRISKLKSLSVVAHAKEAEQACELGKAVAKNVEPELPPELAGHVPG